MNQHILNVTARLQIGRSASRRVRKANQIPAILYGKHSKPEALSLDAPEFAKLQKVVGGRALVIELHRKDKADKALSFIQEVQRDPITDRFLHVDLQEVKADEKVELNIPVQLTGEAYGVKTQGGVLELTTQSLRIRCLPKDLPPVIEVDVTELKAGEALKVGTLKPVNGVEFRDAPGQAVVACIAAEEDPAADTSTPAGKAAAAKAAPAKAAPAKAPAGKK